MIRAMPERMRLDQALVHRGIAPSRERAQALILAGKVRVGGQRADRAAMPVGPATPVDVEEGPRYVSRGALKLVPVLERLAIDVTGAVALDLGSSTGGFTQVLLERGASRVYAVDVGKGQLEWRLRNDPRVVVMEGVNAREGFDLPELVDLIVADLSFISVRVAVPPSFRHLREGGDAVVLVKPQFEAGREAVGKGGIVRDEAKHREVVDKITEFVKSLGIGVLGVIPSPIEGAEGNKEFLIAAVKGRDD